MMPAMGNLSRINYAVTCGVGGLLSISGVFDIGSLGAYLLYVKQVSQPCLLYTSPRTGRPAPYW